jgi:geranylgeranyl diphosphate synthase, type II
MRRIWRPKPDAPDPDAPPSKLGGELGNFRGSSGEFEETARSMIHSERSYSAISMKAPTVSPFDLDAYLDNQSRLIDEALTSYLGQFPPNEQTLFGALHYAVFPGGKRIRPILTLAAGELFGGEPKILLPFACAVEMIHAYSLIHDDLPALDNDDLRRGQPTAHKVFGEGMALLAGDGLLTEAFHIISAPELLERLPEAKVLTALHELSRAAGVVGLVGGQAFDLEAENRTVDIEAVELIHARKTGALLHASVRLGAQIAGAGRGELASICRYGKSLGLAFQIADDVLDAEGGTVAGEGAESGRNEKRKATYPAVAGIVESRARLRELLSLCEEALASFGARAAALRAIAAHVAGRALSSET